MPNLYLIGFIIFMVVGFGAYIKISENEKAVLAANVSKLELAVKTQKQAIDDLQRKYEVIAKAQTQLANDLSEAEAAAARERASIDNFSANGLSTEELERRINEEFDRIQLGIIPTNPISKLPITTKSGNKR